LSSESRSSVPVSGDDVVACGGPEVEDEDEVLLVAAAVTIILRVLATGVRVLVLEAAEDLNDTGLGVGFAGPVGVRPGKRSSVKEPHRVINKSTNRENIGLRSAPEPRLGQREYSMISSKDWHQLGTVHLYRDRLDL